MLKEKSCVCFVDLEKASDIVQSNKKSESVGMDNEKTGSAG